MNPKEFVSDNNIEDLFKRLHDELKRDFEEAETNASYYLDENGRLKDKEINGSLYNDTLRIKASVRDKEMKLLNMMAARLKYKDARELLNRSKENGGIIENPEQMLKYLDSVDGEEDNEEDEED